MTSNIFHLDFRIRHRRIFTGIVLHQIHKNVYQRQCAVCRLEDEDIEHLLLRCTSLTAHRERVKTLLTDHCGLNELTEAQWDWTYLFGLQGKAQKRNNLLINTVLAFARNAAWMRRNFALYENKDISTERLFANILKAHLRLLYAADNELFKSCFMTHTTLLHEVNGKTLAFAF